MTISVIIPAYNEENYIGETLKSLVESASNNLLEVLVVNNASTDKTAAIASSFPKVRVVYEPKKGLTRARQAGLNAAKGDVLAYIDADTRVSKEWFLALNQEFAENPSLVCLSGPYEYHDLSDFKLFLVKIWNKVAMLIPHLGKTYVIMGGNFAAKKSALLAAGGFNEQIQFYGEDTDIARRLRALGQVKFLARFSIRTSARRLNEEGFFKVGFKYLINYLSVVFFKKPFSKTYQDIR